MASPSLDPLKKALASLELALKQPKNEFIRDSVIQRFEFSFELSWKTMKRFMDDPNQEGFSTRHIIKAAGKSGLIEDVESWIEYQKKRNLTSHTYNEDKAEEVYAAAKPFLEAAKKLVTKLEQVLD